MQWAQSLQFGSGRLTEQFVHHDPPEPAELKGVRRSVHERLRELPDAEASTTILTGGTASHITFLLAKSGDQIQLDRGDLERVVSLVESESADRLVEQYGVGRERAEVLPAGVAAVAAIVEFYSTERILITRRGIREGAIVDSVRQAAS
jgi:exopolyphosphatase/pppGpp-phosphohydrolase